jgi:PTS system mannitol-specific IIC component
MSAKSAVQSVGQKLSAMVMPNLGAFIAWGLITAFFIATGWTPNERLATMVDPMLKWLLPLLIGYTGGKMVYGVRGGVVGAIATAGVIIGANIPMFLGAMAAGPLGGWIIKKFDDLFAEKVPAGFEMLVNNFSAGILGGILAIICFFIIGPVAEAITNAFGAAVGWLVGKGLLPLASIIVEPAKILFLNNAINHGVFTPLGTEQAMQTGKSIYFMIESNPGPGLGILLAYCLAGKGSAKASAPGAIIIHFFGGIHEIYFPYGLMNPILIIQMIAGGFTGVLIESLLGGGLIAPASPGSIIAEMIMTPRGAYFANIAGIVLAAAVSFVLNFVFLKMFGKDDASLDAAIAAKNKMKAESKGQTVAASSMAAPVPGNVKKIVFACDAGMGSSAMGATKLKKKIREAGLDIVVEHASVSEVPQDADIIVCHKDLSERAAGSCPSAKLVTITDFLNAPEYTQLVEDLKKG